MTTNADRPYEHEGGVMTNAGLIRAARDLPDPYSVADEPTRVMMMLTISMADALEAAEAQVARLAEIETAAQAFFASDSWCAGLRDHVSAKACPCGYAQLRAAFEPAAPMEEA